MRRLAELWPESELDRRNSYTLAERRVSTIEVRQTVLTAEGAGLTIANLCCVSGDSWTYKTYLRKPTQ